MKILRVYIDKTYGDYTRPLIFHFPYTYCYSVCKHVEKFSSEIFLKKKRWKPKVCYLRVIHKHHNASYVSNLWLRTRPKKSEHEVLPKRFTCMSAPTYWLIDPPVCHSRQPQNRHTLLPDFMNWRDSESNE